jgi:flagellar motor switch protein FliN/FliY
MRRSILSDPELNPLEDLMLPGDDMEHDPLNDAIAELQDVIDKDHDLGPLEPEEEFDVPDLEAAADELAVNSGLNALVLGIPVQLDVVIGSAEMPVADLIDMEAGTVVTLNRKIGDPVDICVNGTKIATGEIQALDDDPTRLGVRITALGKS